jgi:hypothetical protein
MKALQFVNPLVLRVILAISVIAVIGQTLDFITFATTYSLAVGRPTAWPLILGDWFFGVHLSYGILSLDIWGAWPALLLIAVSILAYNLSLSHAKYVVTED